MDAKILLADKGYDSDAIRLSTANQGITAHIPSRSNRIEAQHYDKHIYKEKYKIECLFGFLKHFRRLFSRFGRKKKIFQAFIHFIASLQWIK